MYPLWLSRGPEVVRSYLRTFPKYLDGSGCEERDAKLYKMQATPVRKGKPRDSTSEKFEGKSFM